MTLQSVNIINVKGIHNRFFPLQIIPNKPSILYAPNGFGKSSLAIAFDSISGPRLELKRDYFYRGDERNLPELHVDYLRPDGTTVRLTANSHSNSIRSEIDTYVINSKIRAKSIAQQFGGRTNHSASIVIDTVELIGKIPPEANLPYSINVLRARFGVNGKVLPNLEHALQFGAFLSVFYGAISLLQRLTQIRNSSAIAQFKERVNAQPGNGDAILDWIEANELPELEKIEPLRGLAQLIMGLDLGFVRQSERYLSVLEMLDLYLEHTADFKKALERKLYLKEKTSYVESFRAFNSTWKDIRPRERDNKLVVEFPKAHNISNGQRDILCLVAHLEVARRKLKKRACVLVIDEVFDYLDEGNLVAAQYYITEFIEDFRKQNRRIYPLILTHLNPGYFRNFSFNKMKTYYLDARVGTTSASFRNLIINRRDPSIEDDVSRYLLHFHIDTINKRQEFHALGLRETWGEGTNFINYLDGEMAKYIDDLPNYDPYAVCCSLRRRVEENVYKMIPGIPEQQVFLGTHTTVAKLEYAENLGINVPEYYYILANVYNEGMHWRADRDNESPLKAKFDNGVIRKLIHDVFS